MAARPLHHFLRVSRGTLRRLTPRKGIARKIMLGYLVPLIVLLVAGLLIPVFVWAYTARYRGEYVARKELVSRVSVLVHAGSDVDEAEQNLRRYQAISFRQQQGEARRIYQERRFEIQTWFESHEAPRLFTLFTQADEAFTLWDRRSNRNAAGFIPVKKLFDLLDLQVKNEQSAYEPYYQTAEAARWLAIIVFPLLALISALWIGRSIALSITTPLAALSNAAELLERDALTELALFEEGDSDDELGELRRAFRRMTQAVVQREQTLETRSEALAATGRRLESVLNATNDGIALLSQEGVFTLVNPRFAALFGMEASELLGTSFSRMGPRLLSLFKSGDREIARQRLRELLRTPNETAEETYSLARPLPRVLRLFSTPVEDAEGFIGRIVVLRDVTRETEADRLKSEFASTVSHELRTPLTAISGNVALLLDEKAGPLTDDQREFLTLTRSSAERLTDLINEMLDLSRLESGGLPMRRIPVDCAPVIQQAVRTLEEQARLRELSLMAVIPENLPLAQADPDRLAQVMLNLISNALKYTPAGGRVVVRAAEEEGWLSIKVSDTGIGIEPEERAQLFSKFFRADNSTTRNIGGTGLGLAISKAIIDQLGGRIWVESTPRIGSTFAFILPLANENTLVVPPARRKPEGLRRLALLIHDQTPILHRLNHSLSQQGMIVSAAATREEALRRARGLRPDTLLLPAFTTAFDAFQLLRELRADPTTERLMVLLYTASPIGNTLELGDTLAVAPLHKIGTALSQLRTAPASRNRPLVVLGLEPLARSARLALPQHSDTALLWCESVEELVTKLGPLCPLALVCDTTQLDTRTLGSAVRNLHERHAGQRIPLLFLGDFGPRTRSLVPQGSGPVPLEHLAETIQEAMAAAL